MYLIIIEKLQMGFDTLINHFKGYINAAIINRNPAGLAYQYKTT